MIDVKKMKTCIAARPEDFLHELFGERLHRAGTDSWRVGKKGSLSLDIKDGEIVYFDHESCKGGDCISLWARERACDPGTALKLCVVLVAVLRFVERPFTSVVWRILTLRSRLSDALEVANLNRRTRP